VVGRTLEALRQAVAPGVTTGQLDAIARDALATHGATSSFLGYYGYPAVICASVNDEIVHGIPGNRVLNEGDQISIDFGAIIDGWNGDAAITVPVGSVSPELEELSRVTEASMWAGLSAAVLGGVLNDIGTAVEATIRSAPAGPSYGIVQEYVGHGIGSKMHMEPNVPNYAVKGKTPTLVEGMALAIEPMVCSGSAANRTLDDEWTVVTVDGSRACHWEHTVAITAAGPWVLTALDGGAEYFASVGIASPAASKN
jgi:methionyl aminopeptidase